MGDGHKKVTRIQDYLITNRKERIDCKDSAVLDLERIVLENIYSRNTNRVAYFGKRLHELSPENALGQVGMAFYHQILGNYDIAKNRLDNVLFNNYIGDGAVSNADILFSMLAFMAIYAESGMYDAENVFDVVDIAMKHHSTDTRILGIALEISLGLSDPERSESIYSMLSDLDPSAKARFQEDVCYLLDEYK